MGKAKKIPDQKVRAKRNSNLLLTKKKTVLLLRSHVIEQYPEWIAILSGAPLTKARLSELTPEQQQFAHNLLLEVLAQAEKEWRLADGGWYDDMGPFEDAWIRCSLCKTPNRKIYHIVNTVNGTRLNVGSDCEKEFDIETGGASLAVLTKEYVRLNRKAELDNKFAGIEFTISNWSHDVERLPLVIPTAMQQPFDDLGSQARGLYDRFIDPDRKWTKEDNGQGLLTGLEQALSERARLLSQMTDYVSHMSGNRFAVQTAMINWLQRRGNANDLTAIEWLRADGVIKGRTAFRIPEPEFMQSLSPDLNQLLTDIGFALVRAVPDRVAYVVRQSARPRIHLTITHEELLSRCGPILFDGEPYDLTVDYIVEKGSITDRQSTDAALGELSHLLNDQGIRGVVGDDDLEDAAASFGELVVLEGTTSKYIVVPNLNALANEFRGLIFKVGSKTVQQLHQVITHNTKRFYRDELLREYLKRMQERRELRGR